MQKTKSHRGRRIGAGRRVIDPDGPTRLVTATVPIGLGDRLEEFALAKQSNRSKTITEAIRGILGEK